MSTFSVYISQGRLGIYEYVWVQHEDFPVVFSTPLKVFREQPRHSLGLHYDQPNILTGPYYRLNMHKNGQAGKARCPAEGQKANAPWHIF